MIQILVLQAPNLWMVYNLCQANTWMSHILYTKFTQYTIQHDLDSLIDFTPNVTNNTNIKADCCSFNAIFTVKDIQ